MKQILIAIVFTLLHSLPIGAQTLSLADALQQLNQRQSEYEISFIHNELEHLEVVANTEGVTVPKAVKRLTKDQPVRVVTRERQIFVQYKPKADNRKLWLQGKVLDNLTHLELPHSTVRLLTADGQVIDSCEAISHSQYNNGPVIEHSDFSFQVPARPANYIIQASYVGFKTMNISYELKDIYQREQRRDLPPVYMKRDVKKLPELTVTASKIQFYYKGDTLVFNADAFELAEGSMLDALVRQLPGIELKEGGAIYHNGKYVDALLLNGKDFFRGDHTIMLDNLPAYTVKNIQIYDKWGDQSEFLGQHVMGDSRYVMDVKLKREYSIGIMANGEAGSGTEERWLARIFALRFTDHSRLAAYATANNLNGDSKPGENSSWTQQRIQDGGRLAQRQAGMDYSVDERDSRWKTDGNVQLTYTDLDRQSQTNRQNFLAMGDTYDRISHSQRDKNIKLNTSHHYYRNFGMWNLDVRPNLNYEKFDNSAGSLSSAFYQGDSLINHNLQQGFAEGHQIDGTLTLNSTFKFHHSPDWASITASASYTDRQEDRHHSQRVQYAAVSQQPQETLNRNYYDHPNRSWRTNIQGTYQLNFTSQIRLQIIAAYTHEDYHHDSSAFDLTPTPSSTTVPLSFEEATVPLSFGEGTSTMLPHLSYMSHRTNDTYSLQPRLFYNWHKGKTQKVWAQLGFPFDFNRQRLDYQRGNIDTTIVRRTIPVNIWDCFVKYTQMPSEKGNAYRLCLQYIANTQQPDLLNLVNMRDDTDPLNIHLGNNRLSNAINHQFSFIHEWANANHQETSHRYSLGYTIVQNALTMGCQYNRSTGIRTWQTENVNGNWEADADYRFNTAIGHKHPLRLSVSPSIRYQHSIDLISDANPSAATTLLPHRNAVNTLSLNNGLTLSYKLGNHSLNFKSTTLWQRLTSKRPTFQTQQPLTLANSLSALLRLPWKMELSTDIGLYTRTGYADTQLNTSDLVWNMRFTQTLLKGRLLLMLDGFDLLGQLSNVTRTMNAQGRTEITVNALPRYILLHAVYRLNIQPKSKVSK